MERIAIYPGSFDPEAIIEVTPPSFAIKVSRIILPVTLALLIADMIISPNFSPLSQFSIPFLILLIIL